MGEFQLLSVLGVKDVRHAEMHTA